MIVKNVKFRIILRNFGPFFGLILIFLFFSLIAPNGFMSLRNIETILRQTTIVGMAALGMTYVIIMGGIDLSVGSIIALTTVVMATVLQGEGTPFGAVFYGLLAGLMAGMLNGFLVTALRIVPFIVTLGSLLIIRGAAKGIANEQKVDAPLTVLAELLAHLHSKNQWMLFPLGVWLVFVLAIILILVLNKTVFGRQIVAIGSNVEAARLCGVKIAKVKFIVYSLVGFFAGLAGVLQFSRLTVGDPTVAIGLELDVIAAVVIGGGSLSGGEGSITGSLIGALIMTVIRAGCSQMGIANWVQEIITGTIIVGAVFLDHLRRG